MKFGTIAHAFETIESQSSRLAMTESLANLFKQASPEDIQELCYLALGTLNPPYISTQFALAQKSMIKIVAQLLGKSDAEVQKELHVVGDLGELVAGYELKISASSLTLGQVYKTLVAIEKISGTGSQEKKAQAVSELFDQLDVICAKYVIRIILGTLRLGFSDMTVLDALSWMETGDKSLRAELEEAYNNCADIGLIARILKKDGVPAIKDMHIHLGIPIRPAAAERLPSAQAIIEKIGPCAAQPKLDGFRLQVHIDNTGPKPLIHFFSRNLIDMSAMFPDLVAVCQYLPVKTLIADGEAIVYDPNTHTYLSFQETVKRKRKHGIDQIVSELPLQLNLFDIMYLDGKSLLNEPQLTRRALLKNIFAGYKEKAKKHVHTQQLGLFTEHKHVDTHHEQTLQVIDEVMVSTAQELEHYFLQEIAEGLEGVVVKKTDSRYQAGKRNFNWIKLKYQASDKLEDTLDVVILGYYPGRGKRAAFGIGAFLVGVYNKELDCYQTVAKIGTGLSDQAWIDLKKQCDAHAVMHQPKEVMCAKELYPAVWVAPTIVCEVLADEITFSPLHTAGKTTEHVGLALRFPRFVKYRPDKDATQTTSVTELLHLKHRAYTKIPPSLKL